MAILDFLGVSRRRIDSNLKKVNPDRLRDAIANYDEVDRILRGTPYERFLVEADGLMSAEPSAHRPVRILAGSGRSGTTWVLDCLCEANELRPVFEPLHPSVTPLGSRYAYRALFPDDGHPELESYLRHLANGACKSLWDTYRGRSDRLLPGFAGLRSWADLKRLQRRWRRFLVDVSQLHRASARGDALIKCIRANLALGWMKRALQARIVLILRHPCAVVESQLRRGQVWDPAPVLQRFRHDACLDRLSNGRYRALLAQNLSTVQALSLAWVIDNQLPAELAKSYGFPMVCYEDLASSDRAAWRIVCEALALERLPENDQIERPSQQASRRSDPTFRAEEEEPRWRKSLGFARLDEIQRLLDAVEFGLYSCDRAKPLETVAPSGHTLSASR